MNGCVLSATPRQMERPTLASILEIAGFAEGVVALIDDSMDEMEWILLLSTTCRELCGLFRLWRWTLVEQEIVRLQQSEAAHERL